ncbi:MAG: hypothetical protein HGB19_11955 [Chlorobiales bacterium]|nr:hypothetical protein [Chlorobiales bacterium]
MFRCEGDWQGTPLEKQGKLDLEIIKKELQSDVAYLQALGPRNSENETAYIQLGKCAEWVKQRWESQGYTVKNHEFTIDGRQYVNLEVEIPGQ